MEWTRLNSNAIESRPDLAADRPRLLEPSEIEYIISHLPYPPAADIAAAEVARAGIVEWLQMTLSQSKICPSAIPELKDTIVRQFMNSIIAPGTPVGITAGEAVGASTTQMTLNTFHSSGSAKSAGFGIEAMRSLVLATKKLKNEVSTIYFNNKTLTYEQVLNFRQSIVGSVVGDFVVNHDIGAPNELPQFWWHQITPRLREIVIPPAAQVLRLYLNVVEMYKHRVSIDALAKVLQRESAPAVIAVYGPIGDGIIDLYPTSKINESLANRFGKSTINIPQEIAEMTFLESVVMADLKTIRVKGIAGIRKIYPIRSPVWRIVMEEKILQRQHITSNDMTVLGQYLNPPNESPVGRAWILILNPAIMKTTGLSTENLGALCRAAGVIVHGTISASALVVSLPADRWTTQDGEVVHVHNGRFYRLIPRDSIVIDTDGSYWREITVVRKPIASTSAPVMPTVTLSAADAEEIANVIDPASVIAEVAIDRETPIAPPTANVIDVVKEDPANFTYWEHLDDKLEVQLDYASLRVVGNDKFYRQLLPGSFETANPPEGEWFMDSTGTPQPAPPRVYEMIDSQQFDLKTIKPNEYVTRKIAEAKEAHQRRLQRENLRIQQLPKEVRAAEARKINIPRSPIMNAAEFIYADTDGSNLKELLALPGIDKSRTTCNNMYTITDTLGIEAARTFLVRSLTQVISNTSSYVHPAHVMLIAEFITSRGEPLGATYTGISRQPGGHLTLATLERAGKVFTQSALHGRKEDIRNVSAAVGVGARMSIGTGAFDIAQDISEDGTKKRVINDDVFTALKRDDASRALLQEQRQIYGISSEPEKAMTLEEQLERARALEGAGARDTYAHEHNIGDLAALRLEEARSRQFQGTAQIQSTLAPVSQVVKEAVQRVIDAPATGPISAAELVSVVTSLRTGVVEDLSPAEDPTTLLPLRSTGIVPLTDAAPLPSMALPESIGRMVNPSFPTEPFPPGNFAVDLPINPLTQSASLPAYQSSPLEGNQGQILLDARRAQTEGLE